MDALLISDHSYFYLKNEKKKCLPLYPRLMLSIHQLRRHYRGKYIIAERWGADVLGIVD